MGPSFTKLAAKLVKIMENLGSVPKKGYNNHQKYHYMREVDVMEALKTELISNKIIMLTSSKLVDIQKKEGKDKTDFVTTVETQHTFIDSESGEVLNINSVGSGYDSSDKGAAKAITSAIKYAIMKTFMISDEGLDIENDGETVQPPAVKSTPLKIGKVTTAAKKEDIAVVDTSGKTVTTSGAQATIPQNPEIATNDTTHVTEKRTIPTKVSLNVGRRPTAAKLEVQPTNTSEPNF
jgi:hypothetical protein